MNPHRHDPRDCPTTTCRYCGPDAGMWAIGEFVIAPLLALWWLVRHPAVALLLVTAGVIAAAVYGVL